MAIGAFAGWLIIVVHKRQAKELLFDPRIFFFVMLPPIIFSAGYNMKRKNFFRYFSAIMLFAIFGTMIAITIMAFSLFYLCKAFPAALGTLSLIDAWTFATLIANVDPVATLSILGAIDADRMLYSIVFGESMLNDSVSVVLFHTLTKLSTTELVVSAQSIFKLVGLFLGSACGSIAFGIGVGLVASFCFRHASLHLHPPIEAILVLLFSYIAYSVPEIIGLSGIMSLFFCGIMLAHYNWYNLSEEARATTRHGIEALSFLTETSVYLYLGLNFAFSFERVTDSLEWNGRFLAVTIALCFVSRAVGVFGLSAIYNWTGMGRKPLPFRMQIVLWFSGLRGSVAFALALNVPGDNTPVFVTTTLATVLFTTLFCGGLTETLVSRLGLKEVQLPPQEEPMLGMDLLAHLGGDGELMRWEDESRSLLARWKRFDKDWMKHYFGGKQTDRVVHAHDAASDPSASPISPALSLPSVRSPSDRRPQASPNDRRPQASSQTLHEERLD